MMAQLISTLAMVGLIWFVQVVHYPLFGIVGVGSFHDYQQAHQQRTGLVVAPLMLTEAVTSLTLLWLRPAAIPMEAAIGGVLLVAMVWVSTFFWQVPFHKRLSKSFDAATHRQLVKSNWVRTAAWSIRGVLICWMCLQLITNGNVPLTSTISQPITKKTTNMASNTRTHSITQEQTHGPFQAWPHRGHIRPAYQITTRSAWFDPTTGPPGKEIGGDQADG